MSAPLIRTMTSADLELALSWAEAEGWNPGLADADAFLAADPNGFLVAEIGGHVAASLSIVRFGAETAFLGLYIVRPDHRGRGIGLTLWHEGIARLAPRTTGLDGVPAQQANYACSGFVLSHRNLRFSGVVAPPKADPTEPLGIAHIEPALALDRAATGFDRARFLRDWLRGGPTRTARVFVRDGRLAGLGVLRRCATGVKLGPLFADDRAAAEAVLDGLAFQADGARLSLDVPEPNAAAMALAGDRGLAADFETARMWRGPAPVQDFARTYGVTTLELG